MKQGNPKINIKAIMALLLSCLSLVCCFQWQTSLILAVLGIVSGVLGVRDENTNQQDAAIAGIVIGVVALVLAVVIAVLFIVISRNTLEQGLVQ